MVTESTSGEAMANGANPTIPLGYARSSHPKELQQIARVHNRT